MRVLAWAALALASASVASALPKEGDAPEPFPSLREFGDKWYTTLSLLKGGGDGGAGEPASKTANATAAVAGLINKKTHALTNAKHDALGPLGVKAYDTWLAISAKQWAEFNKTGTTTCDPSKRPADTAKAFSFAWTGSGNLIPFYQGVVQGLQSRGVLTPEVMATASFGGISGGAITAVLTAVGLSGFDQLGVTIASSTAYAQCLANPPPDGCDQLKIGKAVFVNAITAKDPDAAKNLSGRASVWACQVDVASKQRTNKHSVAQGTDTWESIDDLAQAVVASSTIPCRTTLAPYTVFRGSAYIDGGYCSDFAEACPAKKVEGQKCVKASASFLGLNLDGTTYPTVDNCPAVTPSDYLPYAAKPYLTPGNLTPPPGSESCEAEDVPFVRQGVSAKPDIYPFFYQEIAPVFGDGCGWLSLSSGAPTTDQALAMFNTGVVEAFGWADAHGYCATPPPP